MTKKSASQVPPHLQSYVVDQTYERYTPEDQAVWRYALRQLKDFLSVHAHPCYTSGLEKTGISIDRIPRIEDMDQRLQDFGWRAVPVSGFIPPAAFMEFQSLGILPIASDIRSLDHLHYTPAPDIIHEAAGHAPILIDEKFSDYLRGYASIASKALLSKEDLDLYEAIRDLSDIKESPNSTQKEVQEAELRLERANQALTSISEAARLSRMNWWTAEYGLIGSLESPKLFGAGLLSSIGESRECLSQKVKKIPLDITCVDYSYDITEPQPQLFVTPDFEKLHSVLHEYSERMAFKRGGLYGLEEAKKAGTLNTVELNSGIQISGRLSKIELTNNQKVPALLIFDGPFQLSQKSTEIRWEKGQHKVRSNSGNPMIVPIGFPSESSQCLSDWAPSKLDEVGIVPGQPVSLSYDSGVKVKGVVGDLFLKDQSLLVINWRQLKIELNNSILFESKAEVFMPIGSSVVSVFGGAADREAYGDSQEFVSRKVSKSNIPPQKVPYHNFYAEIRKVREASSKNYPIESLYTTYQSSFSENWLMGIEILELAHHNKNESLSREILEHLDKLKAKAQTSQAISIEDGIRLAPFLNL